MSSKKNVTQAKNAKAPMSTVIIAAAAVVLMVVALLVMNGSKGGKTVLDEDIVIDKSEVTDKVTFIPTQVGNQKMEVMVVKASDGTIRTAFNTCQVCNGSPRAYYEQSGNVVVCQNCGNRFSMDMIEKQRGGCNPVPIGSENKTDNGDTITISKEFIAANKGLFTENWKTR